jgi:hypothetical protein
LHESIVAEQAGDNHMSVLLTYPANQSPVVGTQNHPL